MRWLAPAFSLLVVLSAACSSWQSAGAKPNVEVALPGLQIQQLSALPAAAAHVTGGVPVQYSLTVQNRAGQPITLMHVNVVSMGYGAYDVSGSTTMKTLVQPAQTETVAFWIPANISNPSLIGANGPVTLRITAQFDSPMGAFQEVVVQQVNATNGLEQ